MIVTKNGDSIESPLLHPYFLDDELAGIMSVKQGQSRFLFY
jgi:hypothetical protein